ncbi:MAG: Na+/H+ antiporter NhaC family protein [Planctomycetota bacterium]|jgi:Na+/H+ antiporter NhaC|nr:Na+/H+ antiporter NhaC family protein [Planctomycetota bacterium]MDP6763720.1 Na+/H+ antiporter NhaC family protein [Planctomycetota bacterium]MDP6990155.1 Na+/H+ antiporter NhaC family protein [Planctomycetota bacterium]
MTRLVSGLFLLGLLAGVFVLPEPPPARLATLDVPELIATAEARGPGGEAVPLSALLLGSDAFEATGPDGGRLALGAVRAFADGAREPQADASLRAALARALREAAGEADLALVIAGEEAPVESGGLEVELQASDGQLVLSWRVASAAPTEHTSPWTPPSKRSLLPPVVAIGLALLLRRPVPALFLGVLTAAFLLRFESGEGLLTSAGGGLVDLFGTFLREQLVDSERQYIIVFVVAMLAMVGVVTRNGGLRGIMNLVARIAGGVRRTQIAAYLMGLAVFFDDYANTILVGSTMRPLTDKLRIAREKLAYVVDSTAAPVAGISIFSTWIAFEVSTFSAQLPLAGLSPSDGYAVFLETLPYRFYCIFSLVLVAVVVIGGRDFGPMLAAERRARTTGALVRPGGEPMVSDIATTMRPAEGVGTRAHRALVPLGAFLFVTLFEIARRGGAFDMSAERLFSLEGVTAVLFDGSGSKPLAIGSSTGLGLAVLFSLAAGLRGEILDAAWKTLRAMGVALVILYLAWMLGAACGEVGTARFLTAALGDMAAPLVLPAVLFVLSGAVAFATGSSWGTMSILLPLVVGLSFSLGQSVEVAGAPAGHFLMVLSIGAVLEGSIFGDHCSPISDTTVLSSVAAASDHIDHVRTQAPYAILAMTVAMLAGYLPCAFLGLSPWIAMVVGAALLIGFLRVFGRSADGAEGAA